MIVRIPPYDFYLPDRFQPGPIDLSPGEATALNTLLSNRAYNRGQTLIARVAKLDVMSLEEQLHVQSQLISWASSYQFPTSPPSAKTILEEEVEKLLTETLFDVDSPTLQREARRRATARLAALDPDEFGR